MRKWTMIGAGLTIHAKKLGVHQIYVQRVFKAGPPPLEAILVIFGRRTLIFFV